MRTTSLVLVFLAVGCAGEPEDPGVIYQTECPPEVCSRNSGEVLRNGMHEANLFGEVDENKMSLATRPPLGKGLRRRALIWDAQGAPYDLYVVNGRISGVNPITGARISGPGLVGAQLHVLASSQPIYNIRIDGVREIPTAVGMPDPIEIYRMVWVDATTLAEGPPCEALDTRLDEIKDPTPLYGMRTNETLVYEGDRINAHTKTMNQNAQWDPNWFNFGCAGRTLAKLRLLRKTQGNGTGNWRARQAALKMLSADYCGTGTSFTRTGMHIDWMDAEGLVHYAFPPLQMEARWTEKGATCLSTPRMEHVSPHVREYVNNECLLNACDLDPTTRSLYDLSGTEIVSALYD